MSGITNQSGVLNFSRNDFRLPSLEAFVFSAAGLAILLIGSWVPDDRLNVVGVPMDIAALCIAVLVSTMGRLQQDAWVKLLLLQAPIMLLLVTLLWSPTPGIGLEKVTTALVSASVAFMCFNTVVEKYGERELAKLLLFYLAVLLAGALIYKILFGFFNRQVVFLMNGAIVFARLMCIAALLALFGLSGRLRKFAVLIFCLAVLWTESKGPILALAISLFAAYLYKATPARRIVFVSVVAALLVVILSLANLYGFDFDDLGRLGVIFALLSGDSQALASSFAYGSAETRMDMWASTIKIIPQHPMGVGIGGWDYSVDTYWPAEYPHNLFLELWSEGGIFLGSIAALPFFLFLFGPKNLFWYIALTLLLAQLLSGDIGDGRFLLTFSFLTLLSQASENPLKRLDIESAPIVDTSLESSREVT